MEKYENKMKVDDEDKERRYKTPTNKLKVILYLILNELDSFTKIVRCDAMHVARPPQQNIRVHLYTSLCTHTNTQTREHTLGI